MHLEENRLQTVTLFHGDFHGSSGGLHGYGGCTHAALYIVGAVCLHTSMAREGGPRTSARSQLLLGRLRRFFQRAERRKILSDVLHQKSTSLRTLEHFVSKQGETAPIVVPGTMDVLSEVYAQNLKSYGKSQFDPFCRGDRVILPDVQGKTLSTTVGQLNFFRFVIANNVLNLFSKHGEKSPHRDVSGSRLLKRRTARKPARRVRARATAS